MGLPAGPQGDILGEVKYGESRMANEGALSEELQLCHELPVRHSLNPSPNKGCEGVVGMMIDQGDFDGVALDGLSWVAVARWPGPLHEGNGEVQPFIDERASDEQRTALLTILTGQAG